MNIYCSICKKEMEIEKDLGSEIHVFSCGCDELAALQTAAREVVAVSHAASTPAYKLFEAIRKLAAQLPQE